MSQEQNRTVVITGASAGIGRALAFEFAARGYKLGLTARRMEVLEQVREEIRAAHPSSVQRIELQRLDVDATETVGPALHALFAALGGVNIVVVNAGINDPTFIGKGHLAKEAKIIQTNVIGAIAWIWSMLLTGYILGRTVPAVAGHIEKVILLVIFLSILPGIISWFRQRAKKSAP